MYRKFTFIARITSVLKLHALCSLLALWPKCLVVDVGPVTWHAAMDVYQMWICRAAFAVH